VNLFLFTISVANIPFAIFILRFISECKLRKQQFGLYRNMSPKINRYMDIFSVNLHRHIDGWMTWSRYKLWLSWLGFTDIHTGIDKYYVSLGSQYMMDDLNKVTVTQIA
jgi:hypothetical protein